MHEINLSKVSNIKAYKSILKALESYGATIVDPDYYEQLELPVDQIYIDYNFEESVITLHMEHYLGIFLLSELQ